MNCVCVRGAQVGDDISINARRNVLNILFVQIWISRAKIETQLKKKKQDKRIKKEPKEEK